ncbi:hypothetical protein ACJBCE_30275 [Streptomyces sp. NBUL23]|uniref:hypothetical protein n=1 Tax=Streptomyces sp. NBUL23 TaxID=3381354 RepID=UPI00387114A4
MTHDGRRIRLHERWSVAPVSDDGRTPALPGTPVPPGSLVLVSGSGDEGSVRILPAALAAPLGELARRGETGADEADLPPTLVRALELDGTLRVSPRGRPARAWREQAGSDTSTSVSALGWAALLDRLTPDQLARRLYFYGRLPVTPRRLRELPDASSVSRWLGLGFLSLETAGFRPLPRTPDTWVWRRWARSRTPSSSKLYVCCLPRDLPYALRACERVLRDRAVAGFKVGFDLPTVLRPDKFVVYLTDPGQADAVAAEIVAGLGAVEAQPLPFTATSPAGPLVARAVDPEDWEGRPAWHERASWRLNICRLAGEALWASPDLPARDRVAAALERLTLAGVDTGTWTWTEATA